MGSRSLIALRWQPVRTAQAGNTVALPERAAWQLTWQLSRPPHPPHDPKHCLQPLPFGSPRRSQADAVLLAALILFMPSASFGAVKPSFVFRLEGLPAVPAYSRLCLHAISIKHCCTLRTSSNYFGSYRRHRPGMVSPSKQALKAVQAMRGSSALK